MGFELRRQNRVEVLMLVPQEHESRTVGLYLSSSVSSSSAVAFSGMASRLRLLLESEPPAGPPLLRLQVSAA